MKWILPLLLLAPLSAHAQMYQVEIPPAFTGQGVMSVTTASKVLNAANVTTSPNGGTFPAASAALPLGVMRIHVYAGGSGQLSICWQGGTCTATNGELFAADDVRVVSLYAFATNPPTMIASTGTITVEVEW